MNKLLSITERRFPETMSFKELVAFDLLEFLKGRLGGEFYICRETRKIKPGIAIEPDTPWDHTVPGMGYECRVWQLIFQTVRYIPTRCLSCWKVVARPRTIQDLFGIRDLQIVMGYPAKCGAEERGYVDGIYSAFWYCNSKEEGLERLEQVHVGVQNHTGREHIPVVLKRYCTEFEIAQGDSAEYKQPPGAVLMEEIVREVFDPICWERAREQPWIIKWHTWYRWMKLAWKHDRANAEKYNNGESFYRQPRIYEKEV